MLVIGERINSSIKKVENAIIKKDTNYIQEEITAQIRAGAGVIDLNAGSFLKTEPEELIWLIRTIGEIPSFSQKIGIALDSSNPVAIKAGLEELNKNKLTTKTIINSVTAERAKLDEILPMVNQYDTQLIGLCMNEHGISESPQDRCKLGTKILDTAKEYGIKRTNIFLDPLVLPVSTDINNGNNAIETIKLLKSEDPEILTVIGLSNISYGLPMKGLLNRTFLVMALIIGLDAAILNPLDKNLMSIIKASETLLGNDEFCMKYIAAYRNGDLVP